MQFLLLEANFFAFFYCWRQKIVYFYRSALLFGGLGPPFWRSGGPLLAVGGPPLHADGRGAPDLKVQKVHRKAGPEHSAVGTI